MEKVSILPTNNQEWGFWGTSVRNGYDPEVTWRAASRFLSKQFGLTAEQTREVLDASFGRHMADDLSFAPDLTKEEAIILWMEERMLKDGWLRNFEKVIHEITGKVFPPKKTKTREEILTQLAEKYLNTDGVDSHKVSVKGLMDVLEAAFIAGQDAKGK